MNQTISSVENKEEKQLPKIILLYTHKKTLNTEQNPEVS